MDYQALKAYILADPVLAAFAADGADESIAQVVNSRTIAGYVKTEFGPGTILAAFGGNGLGGQFIDALETAGQVDRDLYWLLHGVILRGVLDVSIKETRDGMDKLAAAMPPFAAGINTLKKLAEIQVPVFGRTLTDDDIRKALA